MGRTTNKQRREQQAQTAREKAAAARLAQRRVDQRRRARNILSGTVAVIIVVVVIVVVAVTHKGSNSPSGDRQPVTASVLNAVQTVPAATLDQVAGGTGVTPPAPVSGLSPLTSSGKPEVLFIGAEFCPYCAAERWSMAVALSRFGTLHNVGMVRSSATDVDPNTATLDFYKSSYTSKYLTFTPVEAEDRDQNTLQNISKDQLTTYEQVTKASQVAFPFLSIGNKYKITSPSFDPAVLKGMTWQQIANQLKDPNSKVAQAVDGAANQLTAAICGITNGQPAKVCSSSTISGLQSKLNA